MIRLIRSPANSLLVHLGPLPGCRARGARETLSCGVHLHVEEVAHLGDRFPFTAVAMLFFVPPRYDHCHSVTFFCSFRFKCTHDSVLPLYLELSWRFVYSPAFSLCTKHTRALLDVSYSLSHSLPLSLSLPPSPPSLLPVRPSILPSLPPSLRGIYTSLRSLQPSFLTPYVSGKPEILGNFLDTVLGFSVKED